MLRRLFAIKQEDTNKVLDLLIKNNIDFESPTSFEIALKEQIIENFIEIHDCKPNEEDIKNILISIQDKELDLWTSLEEGVSRAVSDYELKGDN